MGMLPRTADKLTLQSNSIPTEEKLKQTWRQGLKLGDILDVLDPVSRWYESTVINRREDMICVHYCGWTKKWDEWVPVDSHRLAPRSTHTKGPDRRGLDQDAAKDELSKWDSRLHVALWCDPIDESVVRSLVVDSHVNVNYIANTGEHELPTNFQEPYNHSPLHIALEHDASSATIALLLDHNADISARNRYHQSPIWAIGTYCDDEEMCNMARFLMMRGAWSEVNSRNEQGATLIDHMNIIKRPVVSNFLQSATIQCFEYCFNLLLSHVPYPVVSVIMGKLFDFNPSQPVYMEDEVKETPPESKEMAVESSPPLVGKRRRSSSVDSPGFPLLPISDLLLTAKRFKLDDA